MNKKVSSHFIYSRSNKLTHGIARCNSTLGPSAKLTDHSSAKSLTKVLPLPSHLVGGLDRLKLFCRYVDGNQSNTLKMAKSYDHMFQMSKPISYEASLSHESKRWRLALSFVYYALTTMHAEFAALMNVFAHYQFHTNMEPTKVIEFGSKIASAGWAVNTLWPNTEYEALCNLNTAAFTSRLISQGERPRALLDASRTLGFDEITATAMNVLPSYSSSELSVNELTSKSVTQLLKNVSHLDDETYVKNAYKDLPEEILPLSANEFPSCDGGMKGKITRTDWAKKKPKQLPPNSIALYAFNVGITHSMRSHQVFRKMLDSGADTIIIVERTTPGALQFIQEARNWFLRPQNEFSIVAPCTHEKVCPMERIEIPSFLDELPRRSPRGGAEINKYGPDGSPAQTNACYFEQAVQVPPFVRLLRDQPHIQHETIRFSYLIVSRKNATQVNTVKNAHNLSSPNMGRALEHPFTGRGREPRLLTVCENDGKLRQYGIPKSYVRQLGIRSGTLFPTDILNPESN